MANEKQSEGKVVNLFEDNGNFHDEDALQKSYERMPESDKRQ